MKTLHCRAETGKLEITIPKMPANPLTVIITGNLFGHTCSFDISAASLYDMLQDAYLAHGEKYVLNPSDFRRFKEFESIQSLNLPSRNKK